MFERFTDKARRVVVLAQDEARLLGHTYIGTEHILLGLLREEAGAAALALDALGIELQAARDLVRAETGRGRGQSGHIPFTPEAKRTLELSLREALQLGQNYIDTEHILLGLVRDPATRGAQVLAELGGTPDAVRLRVVELALPAGSVAQARRVAARIAGRASRLRTPGEPPAGYGALSTRLAALE